MDNKYRRAGAIVIYLAARRVDVQRRVTSDK